MPSIQDVADQINAKLDQITSNTANTAQNTADTVAVAQDIRSELVQANTRLNAINGTLHTGFANLSQGLFAIFELQKVAVAILDHHSTQNDTIICELGNANELLCGITRKFTKQLELSQASLTSIARIEGIAERARAAAAGDYDRALDLERKIKECCPPERKPEERCPEPCERPQFRSPEPDGQGWRPLPPPEEQRDPIR